MQEKLQQMLTVVDKSDYGVVKDTVVPAVVWLGAVVVGYCAGLKLGIGLGKLLNDGKYPQPPES